MLLVKQPTRDTLVDVIEQLRGGALTREAVVSWQKAVVGEYGRNVALTAREGYWYFHSLVFLDVPIIERDGPAFFIRDLDLEEYILDLKEVAANEHLGPVSRLRSHEVDDLVGGAIMWPLTTFRYSQSGALSDRGLSSVRGTFEDRGDMVEHTHLQFDGVIYLVLRQFDEYADQGMILGTDRDPKRLTALMAELAIEPCF